jgi:hypothetical protein
MVTCLYSYKFRAIWTNSTLTSKQNSDSHKNNKKNTTYTKMAQGPSLHNEPVIRRAIMQAHTIIKKEERITDIVTGELAGVKEIGPRKHSMG